MHHRPDIFLSSGAAHFERLRALVPRVREHGRVHVASSFLTEAQIDAISPEVDFLHRPRHSANPYLNFVLFFIRDAHGLARGDTLLKIDTDVDLCPDWFDYVEESIAAHPDAVLLGTHAGTNRIDYDIRGPLVRQGGSQEMPRRLPEARHGANRGDHGRSRQTLDAGQNR